VLPRDEARLIAANIAKLPGAACPGSEVLASASSAVKGRRSGRRPWGQGITRPPLPAGELWGRKPNARPCPTLP
jgi:hypothetical protein